MAAVSLEQVAEKTTYNIAVETGDERGCGTDANVFIILYGESEDSGKIDLKTSKTYKDKFERGHIDEFTSEAIQLGELKKIKIGHDNAGVGSGWLLDNVVVDVPSEGKKYIFQAGRWLDTDKDDGKTEVEIFPNKDKVEDYKAKVPYEFVVYTSDVSGAGTDSNVYVALYGSMGECTEECFLTPKKDCFERGSVDIFVKELEDVGDQIEKLRVGHDNKGFGSDWHLDKVEVRRMNTTDSLDSSGAAKGTTTFTFVCGKWLAKGKDDGTIVRELVPTKIEEEQIDAKTGKMSVVEHRVDALESHHYKVHVFTGDVRKAGTDANVFVTLVGENGDSGERQVMKSETKTDKFERKQEDIFSVEAVDLGYVRKVIIRHDDTNLSSDWFLDRVEVVDETNAGKKYVYPCERWLAKKKDDGKIKRTLYEKNYEGDRSSLASSIGSNMSLKSSTSRKSTLSLNSKASPPLQRKASFSGRSEAADKIYEEQYEKKGLKKSASKRSLLSKSSSLGSLKETIPYTVRVATGESSDHGTTANVYIVLIGLDGASEKLPLELIGKDNGFEKGSVETFSIESPDFGEIKKVEVSFLLLNT
jgi:hypothetical protein